MGEPLITGRSGVGYGSICIEASRAGESRENKEPFSGLGAGASLLKPGSSSCQGQDVDGERAGRGRGWPIGLTTPRGLSFLPGFSFSNKE